MFYRIFVCFLASSIAFSSVSFGQSQRRIEVKTYSQDFRPHLAVTETADSYQIQLLTCTYSTTPTCNYAAPTATIDKRSLTRKSLIDKMKRYSINAGMIFGIPAFFCFGLLTIITFLGGVGLTASVGETILWLTGSALSGGATLGTWKILEWADAVHQRTNFWTQMNQVKSKQNIEWHGDTQSFIDAYNSRMKEFLNDGLIQGLQ